MVAKRAATGNEQRGTTVRKILVALGMILALLALSITPTSAAPAAPAATQSASAVVGWKFLTPNICVADGASQWTLSAYVPNWNSDAGALNLVVRNRCITDDGIRNDYSITNRMTVAEYGPASDGTCAKLTNTHRTNEVWDQNVVLWMNLAESCVNDPGEPQHRVQQYIGWVLGVAFVYGGCHNYVMLNEQCALYITNPTQYDKILMMDVYGARA
jgi:hypothetical protein